MELNALTLVIITIVATIAIIGIASQVGKARKANPEETLKENFGTAWNKIRPILSELFINIFNIYNADDGGFEDLLAFSIYYVKNQIDEADFLLPEEKELFTEQFLRSVLEPRMRELYNQKLKI